MRVAIALLSALAMSCARAPGPTEPGPAAPSTADRYALQDAPASLAPAVARAEAAMRSYRDRLRAQLSAEISRGGPSSAVRVCRTGAPALAAEVSRQSGVEVGRTSARLRSGENVPPPWAAALVAETATRRASEVQPAVFDLGDRIGLLRPAPAVGQCLACHGTPDRIAPDVKATIDAAYPRDAATGYVEGDLRGWFWAEAKK